MIITENIDFDIPCWYAPGGCPQQRYNCKKTCHRYLEMNALINNCGMPNANRYLKALSPDKIDLPAFQRLNGVKENICNFIERGDYQLYLSSKYVKTGKTTWCLKMLYKFFDQIWCGNGFRIRGYFVYVPELLTQLKDYNFKNSAEYRQLDGILKTADLVIWDSIVCQALSPQDQAVLNTYIDKRCMDELCNIYNGEYREEQELNIMLGQRLTQRLMSAEQIVLQGKSHQQ